MLILLLSTNRWKILKRLSRSVIVNSSTVTSDMQPKSLIVSFPWTTLCSFVYFSLVIRFCCIIFLDSHMAFNLIDSYNYFLTLHTVPHSILSLAPTFFVTFAKRRLLSPSFFAISMNISPSCDDVSSHVSESMMFAFFLNDVM